ncbi:hypothetical protein CSOJ01_06540 [Colletotrichum sojae]|uniref:Uncharacterized protein n=1 Tax=Colletotrichum sojae TaxID=2175907 RepID=A0A8H6JCC7_9PEZI|nr:hypothetical protein CSOJ01_06540 [Colletotrichum sojae]
MQLSTLIGASFVAVASALNSSYPPINLGYYSFPHGNIFVAWSPFTPTKTSELLEVCDTSGAVKGTGTWTGIRTQSTYTLDPICRKPFNYTDASTGQKYYNVEAACEDDNIDIGLRPVVTAIVDVASNTTVQTCVPVVASGELEETWVSCSACCSTGLQWSFACSA